MLDRSRYIRYALKLPPTVIENARTIGSFSRRLRNVVRIKITSIRTGTIHRRLSPERARSYPLTESLNPMQLNSTHGRKKHTNTKIARLELILEAFFTLIFTRTQPTCGAKSLFPNLKAVSANSGADSHSVFKNNLVARRVCCRFVRRNLRNLWTNHGFHRLRRLRRDNNPARSLRVSNPRFQQMPVVHEHNLADNASFPEQLVRLPCLGKWKSLRD